MPAAALLLAAEPACARPLDDAAARFKPYLEARIADSLAAAMKLRDCIGAADLTCAQQAWLAARVGWEGAEVATSELFPDLDRAIDPWPDAAIGFHALEAKLFGGHRLDALPEAEALVGNLQEFARQLAAATLTAQGLLNGTARLAFELGDSKAEGGESRFSGNSLSELGYNVAAIDAVLARVFAPELAERNAELGGKLTGNIGALQTLVARPSLAAVDQRQLRRATEQLVMDLRRAGAEMGLAAPDLGN